MRGSEALSRELKRLAVEQGFADLGIAPAVTPTGFHSLLQWLQRGYQGEMSWMESRAELRRHPESLLSGCRSVLMAAMNYHDGSVGVAAGGARISRYAWGSEDYHVVLKRQLAPVVAHLRAALPLCRARVVVDSAPLLERDFGRLAGLGWFGRNTMLISRGFGSWFFLAGILTDAELVCNESEERSYCGTCTRCLDECPTDAFPESGVLDARRCISYLTIELRDRGIPRELRAGVGGWLFGCEVCQEVCPWNRFAPSECQSEFRNRTGAWPLMVDPVSLLRMGEVEFLRLFRGTPLERTGCEVLRRNAAIVLGNLPDLGGEAELVAALEDESGLVRAAAGWALCRRGGGVGPAAVRERLLRECVAEVASDLRLSLEECG
jgi:epoxyqueuosine reductase